MDKRSSVEEDREAGRLFVSELRNLGVDVSAAMWAYLVDEDTWRFYIVSPDVRTRGPLEVYRRVDLALKNLPEDKSIDFHDIYVGDTENSFASTVASGLTFDDDIVHVTDFYVRGREIKDAWVYKVDRPRKRQARKKLAGSTPG